MNQIRMIADLYSKKEWLFLVLFSFLLALIFIDFQPLDFMRFQIGSHAVQVPAIILFPLLFFFSALQLPYIKFVYADGKSIAQKIIFFLINTYLTYLIFTGGFWVWKCCNGNITTLFFGGVKYDFVINTGNVLFWVLYQTILIVYAFSLLKILVSRTKK